MRDSSYRHARAEQSNQDPLNFPIKINNRLASLLRVAETGDGRPTSNVAAIFNDITLELKAQTDKLQQALTRDLPRFNQMAQKLGLQSAEARKWSGSLRLCTSR